VVAAAPTKAQLAKGKRRLKEEAAALTVWATSVIEQIDSSLRLAVEALGWAWDAPTA
jgi:hypothetical protein